MDFAIPNRVPVVLGNSGNHWVELRFRTPEGDEHNCDYRGGSDQAHPETSVERAKASRYLFIRCSGDLKPGDVVKALSFRLHIRNGDHKDPANLTQVELRLGGSLPQLEPPILPEESVAIRDAFSWSSTTALPELNTEGLPSLYYTLVYVEEREQIDALDEMLVHYNTLPLFNEEFERWQGQRGVFTHEGDGRGLFLFALMPAATYNLLRQAALEGNAVYNVIALRDIPQSAKLADGSVSYEALRLSGFLYRGLTPDDVDGWNLDASTGQIRQELFNKIIRAIVKTVATVVKAVVRTIVKGIGMIDRWIGGSVNLGIRLDLQNTDPAFRWIGPMQGGWLMQRAWGTRAGSPVRLSGVRVSAWQRTLAGVLPTLFTGKTNDEGLASLRVTRGKDTSLCVAMENHAAEVTSFLLEIEACDFAQTLRGAQLQRNTQLNIPIRHRYFNVLAQASEGWAYMREVAGYGPHKAEILVGRLANFIGRLSDGAAVAPCFGFPNLAYDAFVAKLRILALSIPIIGPAVSVTIGPAYAVDIILSEDPSDDDPRFDANLDSRGIPSHEYGHYTLCSMMYTEGFGNISIGYTDAILDRLSNNPSANGEAGYINEAFADFLTGQFVGGVNNFEPCGDFPDVTCAVRSLDIDYCAATSTTCLEENFSDTVNFFDQVARVTTLLHDGFDGRNPLTSGNAPANGDVWLNGTNGLEYSFLSRTGSNGDEEVMLSGPAIRRLLSNWDDRGLLLNQANFLGAFSDTMKEEGYNWCQRCEVFALHDSRVGSMTDPELCQLEPIHSWIGPMDGTRTLVFQPGHEGKDSLIWSLAAAGTGGDHPLLEAIAWTWQGTAGLIRSYIEFDLTSIAPGTQIASASLKLSANMSSPIEPTGHSSRSGSNAGVLQRVLQPWNESTLSWNTQPSFSTVGGVPLPQSVSNDQNYTLDLTSMVQDMVDNPTSNHGFVLLLQTEQFYRALRFWSSDAPDSALRPRLEVTVRGCQ